MSYSFNNYNSPQVSIGVYTLCYATIALCFALRMKEFESAGLVIESLFGGFLGSEHSDFIQYHILRTSLTRAIHSLLLFGYVVGLSIATNANPVLLGEPAQTFLAALAVIWPSLTLFQVLSWRDSNWSRHPLAETLKQFCPEGTTWRTLASEINSEFRRIDKVVLSPSTITRLVATENWIFKISLYSVDIAKQSDSVLVLTSADTHLSSVEGDGSVQYVNIDVQTTNSRSKNFSIRLNALDFTDFQNRVSPQINVVNGVTFHKTKIDKFLEVFRETVARNPVYEVGPEEDLDPCMGCMAARPSVKLVKSCEPSQPCTNCRCRPLWCINCMGKWFASRQEPAHPEMWLSSSCTCPVCRSVFCMLDVRPISPPT